MGESAVRLHSLVNDVRFWLVLFFIVRLINITNPPLEIGHNWRMTIGTMVSRNFVEVDADLFHPRLDIAGEKTGITGMEFPLFNYLIAGVDQIVGPAHWHGRLVSLMFTSLGCWFFFLTIRRYLNAEVAFNATLILLVSLWFAYGRKILPDTFSASLTIAAIYFGLDYLYRKDNGRWRSLVLLLLLFTLGVSTKLSSASLMMVFVIPMFDNRVRINKKVVVVMIGILGAIPLMYWYGYWVPHLVDTYGFHHFFMGRDFSVGLGQLWETKAQAAHRFYDNAVKYVGFSMFVYGLAMSFKKDGRIYLYILLAISALFAIFMAKAGANIAEHSYYILAYVPVMALLAGYGVYRLPWKKVSTLILVVIVIEGVLNQLYDFRIKEEMARLEQLEYILDDYMSRDDLLLINSGQYPTPMYFAHRKGWVMSNAQITPGTIDSLTALGLSNVLILKRTFDGVLSVELPILYEDEDFIIHAITEVE